MTVNKENIKELEYLEDGKIFITNNAFRKMLQHVFKYGNDTLEEKQEVMGVCLGKEEDLIKVTEIIPITHGDNVELGFGQEIHDILIKIKNQYLDKGFQIVGWYHSHLGYGIYLSKSDRVNQLIFQREDNPHGFAIVFDYKLLENNKAYGFDIFRFKDPLKGPESVYARVKYEIEKPNTLDYFKWIKNLVEDSQKKKPIIIKEYDEINKVIPEELQEIPIPKDTVIKEEIDTLSTQIAGIVNSSHEGMLKFNEIIADKIQNDFSNWMKDLYIGSLQGIEQIRSTINQMRKTVIDGFEDVESYFARTFKEISEIFIKDVSSYLSKTIENQNELKNSIELNLQGLSGEALNLIELNIESVKTRINERISRTEVKIHNVNQVNNQLKPIIEKLKKNLNDLHKGIDSITDILKENIDKACNSFDSNLKMELEGININSDSLIEKNKEIQGLIERLQKVISDFRQLK